MIDRYGAPTLWAASAVVGTVAAVGYGVLGRRLRVEDQPETVGREAVVVEGAGVAG
ncbi:hypothetical protein SSOG_04826 [Streptomyces himastatinicus ATCC 53653]|uniref:MFS transporter n=1 Tax=Streptomyces himastatinicus ATCC 53653 TaxID=457427 RepID=D9WD50_9ACTN|nr:hypothetical protein SSOG_04826 [Streptomyces himastatinicus ATCC 53653]